MVVDRLRRLARELLPQPRIGSDAQLRARMLLLFAATEGDGARDLVRASELARDPILRRLYLRHASDERRHAALFRERGAAIVRTLPAAARPHLLGTEGGPGECGGDDLRVAAGADAALLAFLHLSEKDAARVLARCRALLAGDPETQAVLDAILDDEAFHMNYTLAQLKRIAPERQRRLLWRARLGRLWKAYLRGAAGLADRIGGVFLLAVYFLLLPPFALLARRALRRERRGWSPVPPARPLTSQY